MKRKKFKPITFTPRNSLEQWSGSDMFIVGLVVGVAFTFMCMVVAYSYI